MKKIKKLGTRLGAKDLTLDQIYEIFRLRDAKYSFRKLAGYVKCSASRACEVYNHEVLTKTTKKLPWYEKAVIVNQAIKANRGRPREKHHKLQKDAELLEFVIKELKNKKSPKTIAYSIKDNFPDKTLCAESIYDYIYRFNKKLTKYLVNYKKIKRNKRASSRKSRLLEVKKRNIEQRSNKANNREEPNHAEGDCIVSCRGGKSCIVVGVDRLRRKIWLIRTPNREAETLRKAYFGIIKQAGFKSLTIDNDPAHNSLPELEKVFSELKVFFCNPYSPWARGTVEAIIGILRRWWPKGTNFDDITDEQVHYVLNWFNNRHSEVLDGLTPNQAAKLVA